MTALDEIAGVRSGSRGWRHPRPCVAVYRSYPLKVFDSFRLDQSCWVTVGFDVSATSGRGADCRRAGPDMRNWWPVCSSRQGWGGGEAFDVSCKEIGGLGLAVLWLGMG